MGTKDENAGTGHEPIEGLARGLSLVINSGREALLLPRGLAIPPGQGGIIPEAIAAGGLGPHTLCVALVAPVHPVLSLLLPAIPIEGRGVSLSGAAFDSLCDMAMLLTTGGGASSLGYQLMAVGLVIAALESDKGDAPSSALPQRLSHVLQWIEEHFTEPIALRDICEISHYNEVYLCRLFRERLGISPLQYVMSLRMKKACRLLEETCCAIKEIAPRVGYADDKQFSRAFKKHMGVSATEYRDGRRPIA